MIIRMVLNRTKVLHNVQMLVQSHRRMLFILIQIDTFLFVLPVIPQSTTNSLLFEQLYK
jgi:hypothetical protein